MPGALLDLKFVGSNNLFLTGNPSKSFFHTKYQKYHNFAQQKFRVDYDGQRDLRLSEESKFTFRIPKYADLLTQMYLVLTLPNIYSPIYHPCMETDQHWSPYCFRWIRHLGTCMIKEIEIKCGSFTLQRYSGDYIQAVVERDFDENKKDLFYRMSGNVKDLYDPANAFGRSNMYPSAYFTANADGAEPSIRGRNLLVPLNPWFTLQSGMAFPLISLRYQELTVDVTIRPISELFQIRDVFDSMNNYPYVSPDFTREEMLMYRFLQTPPAVLLDSAQYGNRTNMFTADVHLLVEQVFLSETERLEFSREDQVYLVKEVMEYWFENVTGAKRIKIPSNGMVTNWMWYLQRNDVKMRNEWANYSNWPYSSIPSDIVGAKLYDAASPVTWVKDGNTIGPAFHPDGTNSGITVTGDFSVDNRFHILDSMGVVLNGEYRENLFSVDLYNYVEKYGHSLGSARDGLYCYNFCLNTSPFETQPCGAINMSMFKSIELELGTFEPPADATTSNFRIICNDTGGVIASNNPTWRLYQYNYNLKLFEERYNVLSFIGGECGLLYAK